MDFYDPESPTEDDFEESTRASHNTQSQQPSKTQPPQQQREPEEQTLFDLASVPLPSGSAPGPSPIAPKPLPPPPPLQAPEPMEISLEGHHKRKKKKKKKHKEEEKDFRCYEVEESVEGEAAEEAYLGEPIAVDKSVPELPKGIPTPPDEEKVEEPQTLAKKLLSKALGNVSSMTPTTEESSSTGETPSSSPVGKLKFSMKQSAVKVQKISFALKPKLTKLKSTEDEQQEDAAKPDQEPAEPVLPIQPARFNVKKAKSDLFLPNEADEAELYPQNPLFTFSQSAMATQAAATLQREKFGTAGDVSSQWNLTNQEISQTGKEDRESEHPRQEKDKQGSKKKKNRFAVESLEETDEGSNTSHNNANQFSETALESEQEKPKTHNLADISDLYKDILDTEGKDSKPSASEEKVDVPSCDLTSANKQDQEDGIEATDLQLEDGQNNEDSKKSKVEKDILKDTVNISAEKQGKGDATEGTTPSSKSRHRSRSNSREASRRRRERRSRSDSRDRTRSRRKEQGRDRRRSRSRSDSRERGKEKSRRRRSRSDSRERDRDRRGRGQSRDRGRRRRSDSRDRDSRKRRRSSSASREVSRRQQRREGSESREATRRQQRRDRSESREASRRQRRDRSESRDSARQKTSQSEKKDLKRRDRRERSDSKEKKSSKKTDGDRNDPVHKHRDTRSSSDTEEFPLAESEKDRKSASVETTEFPLARSGDAIGKKVVKMEKVDVSPQLPDSERKQKEDFSVKHKQRSRSSSKDSSVESQERNVLSSADIEMYDNRSDSVEQDTSIRVEKDITKICKDTGSKENSVDSEKDNEPEHAGEKEREQIAGESAGKDSKVKKKKKRTERNDSRDEESSSKSKDRSESVDEQLSSLQDRRSSRDGESKQRLQDRSNSREKERSSSRDIESKTRLEDAESRENRTSSKDKEHRSRPRDRSDSRSREDRLAQDAESRENRTSSKDKEHRSRSRDRSDSRSREDRLAQEDSKDEVRKRGRTDHRDKDRSSSRESEDVVKPKDRSRSESRDTDRSSSRETDDGFRQRQQSTSQDKETTVRQTDRNSSKDKERKPGFKDSVKSSDQENTSRKKVRSSSRDIDSRARKESRSLSREKESRARIKDRSVSIDGEGKDQGKSKDKRQKDRSKSRDREERSKKKELNVKEKESKLKERKTTIDKEAQVRKRDRSSSREIEKRSRRKERSASSEQEEKTMDISDRRNREKHREKDSRHSTAVSKGSRKREDTSSSPVRDGQRRKGRVQDSDSGSDNDQDRTKVRSQQRKARDHPPYSSREENERARRRRSRSRSYERQSRRPREGDRDSEEEMFRRHAKDWSRDQARRHYKRRHRLTDNSEEEEESGKQRSSKSASKDDSQKARKSSTSNVAVVPFDLKDVLLPGEVLPSSAKSKDRTSDTKDVKGKSSDVLSDKGESDMDIDSESESVEPFLCSNVEKEKVEELPITSNVTSKMTNEAVVVKEKNRKEKISFSLKSTGKAKEMKLKFKPSIAAEELDDEQSEDVGTKLFLPQKEDREAEFLSPLDTALKNVQKKLEASSKLLEDKVKTEASKNAELSASDVKETRKSGRTVATVEKTSVPQEITPTEVPVAESSDQVQGIEAQAVVDENPKEIDKDRKTPEAPIVPAEEEIKPRSFHFKSVPLWKLDEEESKKRAPSVVVPVFGAKFQGERKQNLAVPVSLGIDYGSSSDDESESSPRKSTRSGKKEDSPRKSPRVRKESSGLHQKEEKAKSSTISAKAPENRSDVSSNVGESDKEYLLVSEKGFDSTKSRKEDRRTVSSKHAGESDVTNRERDIEDKEKSYDPEESRKRQSRKSSKYISVTDKTEPNTPEESTVKSDRSAQGSKRSKSKWDVGEDRKCSRSDSVERDKKTLTETHESEVRKERVSRFSSGEKERSSRKSHKSEEYEEDLPDKDRAKRDKLSDRRKSKSNRSSSESSPRSQRYPEETFRKHRQKFDSDEEMLSGESEAKLSDKKMKKTHKDIESLEEHAAETGSDHSRCKSSEEIYVEVAAPDHEHVAKFSTARHYPSSDRDGNALDIFSIQGHNVQTDVKSQEEVKHEIIQSVSEVKQKPSSEMQKNETGWQSPVNICVGSEDTNILDSKELKPVKHYQAEESGLYSPSALSPSADDNLQNMDLEAEKNLCRDSVGKPDDQEHLSKKPPVPEVDIENVCAGDKSNASSHSNNDTSESMQNIVSSESALPSKQKSLTCADKEFPETFLENQSLQPMDLDSIALPGQPHQSNKVTSAESADVASITKTSTRATEKSIDVFSAVKVEPHTHVNQTATSPRAKSGRFGTASWSSGTKRRDRGLRPPIETIIAVKSKPAASPGATPSMTLSKPSEEVVTKASAASGEGSTSSGPSSTATPVSSVPANILAAAPASSSSTPTKPGKIQIVLGRKVASLQESPLADSSEAQPPAAEPEVTVGFPVMVLTGTRKANESEPSEMIWPECRAVAVKEAEKEKDKESSDDGEESSEESDETDSSDSDRDSSDRKDTRSYRQDDRRSSYRRESDSRRRESRDSRDKDSRHRYDDSRSRSRRDEDSDRRKRGDDERRQRRDDEAKRRRDEEDERRRREREREREREKEREQQRIVERERRERERERERERQKEQDRQREEERRRRRRSSRSRSRDRSRERDRSPDRWRPRDKDRDRDKARDHSPFSPSRTGDWNKDRASDFRRSRSPDRSRPRSPDRSRPRRLSGSPEHVRLRSPDRTRPRSPEIRSRSPDRSRNRSPDRNRPRSPDRSRNRSPEYSRGRSPERSRYRSPDRARPRSPDRFRGRSPEFSRDRGRNYEDERGHGRSPVRGQRDGSFERDRSDRSQEARGERMLPRGRDRSPGRYADSPRARSPEKWLDEKQQRFRDRRRDQSPGRSIDGSSPNRNADDSSIDRYRDFQGHGRDKERDAAWMTKSEKHGANERGEMSSLGPDAAGPQEGLPPSSVDFFLPRDHLSQPPPVLHPPSLSHPPPQNTAFNTQHPPPGGAGYGQYPDGYTDAQAVWHAGAYPPQVDPATLHLLQQQYQAMGYPPDQAAALAAQYLTAAAQQQTDVHGHGAPFSADPAQQAYVGNDPAYHGLYPPGHPQAGYGHPPPTDYPHFPGAQYGPEGYPAGFGPQHQAQIPYESLAEMEAHLQAEMHPDPMEAALFGDLPNSRRPKGSRKSKEVSSRGVVPQKELTPVKALESSSEEPKKAVETGLETTVSEPDFDFETSSLAEPEEGQSEKIPKPEKPEPQREDPDMQKEGEDVVSSTNSAEITEPSTKEEQGGSELKPLKVKSRWRRNSEAEATSSTPPPPLQKRLLRESQEQALQESEDVESGDKSQEQAEASVPPPPPRKRLRLEAEAELQEKESEEPASDFPVFEVISENIHLKERKKSKSMKRMVCDCTTSKTDRARGIAACGEDCLNKMLMIECGSRCPCLDHCTNKRFQKKQHAKTQPFCCGPGKGWGLQASEDMPNLGTFVMEYVGELLDYKEFVRRSRQYAKQGMQHHYFMALNADELIDATLKGSNSRFLNHSCDPNCETQKWTVNGELRVGFFTKKPVQAGDELTFDYQFEFYGKPQKCYCGAENCRGYIGGQKNLPVKKKKDKTVERRRSGLFEDEMLDEDMESMTRLKDEGMKIKAHVLELCRLMVRAEKAEHRLTLLKIIQDTTEINCLRLFLGYHGLPLLWSWMVNLGTGDEEEERTLKSEILSVLKKLPISNRTILKESKIMVIVEKWANIPLPPALPEAEAEADSISEPLPLPVPPDRPVVSILALHKDTRDQKGGKKKVTFADEAASSDSDLSDSLKVSSTNSEAAVDNKVSTSDTASLDSADQEVKSSAESAEKESDSAAAAEISEEAEKGNTEDEKEETEESEAPKEESAEEVKCEGPVTRHRANRRPVVTPPRPKKRGGRKKDESVHSTSSAEEGDKEDKEVKTTEMLDSSDGNSAAEETKIDNSTESSEMQTDQPAAETSGFPAEADIGESSILAECRDGSEKPLGLSDDSALLSSESDSTDSDITNLTNVGIVSGQEEGDQAVHMSEATYSEVSYEVGETDEISSLAADLLSGWSDLKELYKIPKKQRAEERKRTERELESVDFKEPEKKEPDPYAKWKKKKVEKLKRKDPEDEEVKKRSQVPAGPKLSKEERRQMFEAKVKAEDEMNAELQRQQEALLQQQQQAAAILFQQNPAFAAMHGITADPSLHGMAVDPSLHGIAADPNLLAAQAQAFDPSLQQYASMLTPEQQQALMLATHAAGGDMALATQQLMAQGILPTQEQYQQQMQAVYAGSSQAQMYQDAAALQQQQLAMQQMAMQQMAVPPQPVAQAEEEDVPPPPSPPVQREMLPLHWKEARDSEGRIYYYHTQTRVTQWDLPSWDNPFSEDMEFDTADVEFEDESHRKTTTAPADTSSEVAKKLKEQFRKQMSQFVVVYLNPYRRQDCKTGRICSTEDFKHLARRLTHHVMAKELKHCRHVEDLEVNENVKAKAKDYVRKYMSRCGPIFKKSSSPDDFA